MVKITLTIFLLFCCLTITKAQNRDTIEIVNALSSWPIFQNDETYQKLSDFVKGNLRYDDTLTEMRIVYVTFKVDTVGNTHDHKIVRGSSPSLDEEALRVCRLITFTQPAMQGDKPVSVWYQVPVPFEPRTKHNIKTKKCIFRRHSQNESKQEN